MSTTIRYRDAYPDRLREQEVAAIKVRRAAADANGANADALRQVSADAVGLALSGGGIRSATFGLGLLQAMAKSNVLKRIDFLSTVSGGGYIGAFLGRLFTRDAGDERRDFRLELENRMGIGSTGVEVGRGVLPPLEGAATAEVVRRTLTYPGSPAIAWLRENGRYLSPNGAGDTLIGVALTLRNWCMARILMWSFLLLVFVFLTLVRHWAGQDAGGFVSGKLWWSPAIWLLPCLTAAAIVPLGWAYWIFPPIERTGLGSFLLRAHILLIVACLAGGTLGSLSDVSVSRLPWVWLGPLVTASLALLLFPRQRPTWLVRQPLQWVMRLLALGLAAALIAYLVVPATWQEAISAAVFPWRPAKVPLGCTLTGVLWAGSALAIVSYLSAFARVERAETFRPSGARGAVIVWSTIGFTVVWWLSTRADSSRLGSAARLLQHFVERVYGLLGGRPTLEDFLWVLAVTALVRLGLPDRGVRADGGVVAAAALRDPARQRRVRRADRCRRLDRAFHAGLTLLAIAVAISAGAQIAERVGEPLSGRIVSVVALMGGLALFWMCAATESARAAFGAGTGAERIDLENRVEHGLSAWLRDALSAAAVVGLFVLVDTLGQSLYAVYVELQSSGGDRGNSLLRWATSVGGGVLTLVLSSRQLAAKVFGPEHERRFRLPWRIAALAIALPLVLVELTTINAVTHGIAWAGQVPAANPGAQIMPTEALPWEAPGPSSPGAAEMSRPSLWLTMFVLFPLVWVLGERWAFVNRSTFSPLYAARLTRAYLAASNHRRWSTGQAVTQVEPGDALEMGEYTPHLYGGPLHLINVTINETASGQSQIEQRDRRGLNLAFGPHGASVHGKHHALWCDADTKRPLASHSGMIMLALRIAYRLRLIEEQYVHRPQQAQELWARVVQEDCWDFLRGLSAREIARPDMPLERLARLRALLTTPAGPATAADTFSRYAQSTIQLLTEFVTASRSQLRIALQPIAPRQDLARPVFRIFETETQLDEATIECEAIPVALAMAVSGAAFSTGLGYRTSLGASLLCGLLNVRLGYWWNSGVIPENRLLRSEPDTVGRIERQLSRVFPVQSTLLQESLARFHGPARRHWYLSDGGHYENLGAYELIRRRLPWIVVSDAEGDPDYGFDGLARLVGAVRTDLGAEISFLRQDELTAVLHPDIRRHFGTPEQLRRGVWSDEPTGDPHNPRKKRVTLQPARDRLSLAHVALAWIRYRDPLGRLEDSPQSLLVHVKPTLNGDEPLDLRHYHAGHPDFPQETTTDQYFDEAQWESYRKLGEHIGDHLLARRTGGSNTPASWLNDPGAVPPKILHLVTRLAGSGLFENTTPGQWTATTLYRSPYSKTITLALGDEKFLVLENLMDRDWQFNLLERGVPEFRWSAEVDLDPVGAGPSQRREGVFVPAQSWRVLHATPPAPAAPTGPPVPAAALAAAGGP